MAIVHGLIIFLCINGVLFLILLAIFLLIMRRAKREIERQKRQR